MSLRYTEHSPSTSLAPFVRCVWTLAGSAATVRAPQPVVPDGCMELILNFGDAFDRHRIDGTFVERQPLELLVGPSTGPAVIVPTGGVDLVGVRLHPWGAAPFLGVEPAALRDELLPVREVSRTLAASMEPVRAGRTAPERLSRLVAALEVMSGRRDPPDAAVRAIVTMLDTCDPLPSVRELAARTGRSTRWIQRGFGRQVGLSPKMLARIGRAQRALRIAERHEERSWAAVAAEAGYFDHSHLVRDFRQIVGCTPTELSVRGGELTEAFLERDARVKR